MPHPHSDFSPELPVYEHHSSIVSAVDANQITIITAETGAGKSTQVPQYLADHGYTKVIVTQPRILAARNLAQRVRSEWALRTLTDATTLVGYRTAHERDDTPDTQILYCTDGLQLVREISGEGVAQKQVLILDEVHEWNENMEVLIAWAKKRCQEDPAFKVVIMSATIDTEPLAKYFGTDAVINIPGRSHPVTHSRGTDVVSEIQKKLRAGRNTLVFLPGKAEIQDVTDAIATEATAAGVPVIPLHSQLDIETQQRAFANYPNGKVILSTNIAQTSVTIDDIDVVIDSGLERRNEVRNGVEGLFVAQISKADCLQRAGRAGRTKPGEYILAQYDTLPCLALEERPPYGTPEILRKHIDRLTLRLANVGIDIEDLDFYHDPSAAAVQRAKRTLIALGAMRSNGSVTAIGRAMERFPVQSNYARMLVEAESCSPDTQSKLAAIIAIQEVGGIVRGGTRYTGWQKLTRQKNSDLLAQYDVFLELEAILPEEYEELGIIGKSVDKAREVMQRLNRDIQGIALDDAALTPLTATQEQEILRCIVAGQIDQLWTIDDSGNAMHLTTRQVRELSSSSVVRYARLITGEPFDLEVPTRDGDLQTLHLVQGVTRVNTEWLIELAPDQFSHKRSGLSYDARSGMLVTRQRLRTGDYMLEGNPVPVTDNSKQNQKFFQEAFAKWAYSEIERQRVALGGVHAKHVPVIPLSQIRSKVRAAAPNTINIEFLPPDRRAKLLGLAKLSTYLGADFVERLSAQRRRAPGDRRHRAHRGHKPSHRHSFKKDKRRKRK